MSATAQGAPLHLRTRYPRGPGRSTARAPGRRGAATVDPHDHARGRRRLPPDTPRRWHALLRIAQRVDICGTDLSRNTSLCVPQPPSAASTTETAPPRGRVQVAAPAGPAKTKANRPAQTSHRPGPTPCPWERRRALRAVQHARGSRERCGRRAPPARSPEVCGITPWTEVWPFAHPAECRLRYAAAVAGRSRLPA